jgi:Glycosyltransferase family 92
MTRQPYLSAAAIYFEETRYLREWIVFHQIVGVEKFFLYDNGNSDDHLEVLAPFLQDGTVVLHEWPERPGQMTAYEHCLEAHRDDSRWIAFLDLDEFLFSPTFRPLPEILVDYEDHPAVVANWVMFGTSGHRTPAPGLVIETHHLRKELPDLEQVKSIVDPTRTDRVLSPHSFTYTDGFAVNENYFTIDRPPWGKAPFSVERLRVNHYSQRSEEEYVAKLSRPQAHSGTFKSFPENSLERRIKRSNAVRDDLIKAYTPAVREALRRLEEGSPPGGADRPSAARA